jgi:hypothetical protein
MKINNLVFGSLAVGMAFGASIAVAPVQAAVLGAGDIGFTFQDGNFLNSIGPNDFAIGLNIPDSSRIDFATGSFADLGIAAGQSNPTSFTGPLELTFESGSGTTVDPWIYTMTNQETFSFDPPSEGLDLVFPAGTRMTGTQAGSSAELQLCESCFEQAYWVYEDDQTPASSTLQVTVSGPGAPSLGQGTSVVVPEPVTILGSLAALGFGTVLKGQQKKKNG